MHHAFIDFVNSSVLGNLAILWLGITFMVGYVHIINLGMLGEVLLLFDFVPNLCVICLTESFNFEAGLFSCAVYR